MLFESDQDNIAHKAGWLVLSPGKAYERQLTLNSAVYIFKTGTGWIVWRAKWSGKPEPTDEKKLATTKTFERAFDRAQSYVEWRLSSKSGYRKAAGS